MRSQNGIRPPLGSNVSVAIATYITSLSAGEPIAQNEEKPLGPNHVPPLKLGARKPDQRAGAKLYAAKCADCHAVDGSGTDDGPPVWGNGSYNSGAGLSRIDKLASWLKVAMPLDDETLSDAEAQDIAAFVNNHPRPGFILQDHLPSRNRMGEYNGKVGE
jgi:thiosulfate dehydrogenase